MWKPVMAKSNAEQTNNDAVAEPNAGGFSPGKIKRLIVVVLFLGAGTFAISQTIASRSNTSDEETAQVTEGESGKQPAESIEKLTQNEVKPQPNNQEQNTTNSFQPSRQTHQGTPQNSATKTGSRQKDSLEQPESQPTGGIPAKPQLTRQGPINGNSNSSSLAGMTNSQSNGFALPTKATQPQTSQNWKTGNNQQNRQAADGQPSTNLPGTSLGQATTGAAKPETKFSLAAQPNSIPEPNGFSAPAKATPQLNPQSQTNRGLRPALPGEAPANQKTMADLAESTAPLAKPSLLKTPGALPARNGVIPTLPRNPVPQTAFDKSKILPPPSGLTQSAEPVGNTPGLNKPVVPASPKSGPNNSIQPTLPATPSAATAPRMGQPQTVAGTNRSVPAKLPSMRSPTIATMQNVSSSIGSQGPFLAPRLTKSTPDRQYEGVQSPSVTIEKIAPREIQVNTPADFQLIVKNVGRITANHVEVHDQVPQGTELMQAMPQPERGPQGQVSWKLGSLRPGQEKRIDIRLKPTTPGVIGSVAHVTFAAQASMRTRVTRPVLTIRHRTQPKVMIGDTVTLEIAVKNEGDGPATNVFVQEDVPQQLAFQDGIRELEYPLGTLAPGQSKNVKLTLKATSVGKLNNTIVAFADGGLQSQHGFELEVVAPNLIATSDGPRKRYLRRKATHEMAVQNAGTARATNIEMVARLPRGLRFVEANHQGKYDHNTHAVYWSMAELGPGQIAQVNLTTLPLEPGDQNIRFETLADLKQNASIEHVMNVEHLTDIFFDIDDVVDPIEVGSHTIYSVRIVNQGTKAATNVQLFVDMPDGIQPTSVEGDITSEIRNQEILFAPITSLNPGDEIALKIHAAGISPGDHRIAINLQSDGREINVTKQESTRVYSDR